MNKSLSNMIIQFDTMRVEVKDAKLEAEVKRLLLKEPVVEQKLGTGRRGKPHYTPEQKQEMFRMFQAGVPIREIAAKLGRTVDGIKAQVWLMKHDKKSSNGFKTWKDTFGDIVTSL